MTKAPSNVVGFLARVRVRSKIKDEKQHRFLVDWALGHKDADIITPMEHGSVRRNGSCKYSLEGRSVANDDEPQNALGKMKNTKTKGARFLACEHGINVNLGRKHTFDCRPTILPCRVTDSMWTVKFDADGKVLKRHEHDDAVDPRDSKRVTHKQPDTRADLEMTDDTVAKRANLFDTPSSSSSNYKVAPNLHDPSGKTGGDLETRESVLKKSRVDAEMEICAIEALTNAKLEVARGSHQSRRAEQHQRRAGPH